MASDQEGEAMRSEIVCVLVAMLTAGCGDDGAAWAPGGGGAPDEEAGRVWPAGHHGASGGDEWCAAVISCARRAEEAGDALAPLLIPTWEAYREEVWRDGRATPDELDVCHCDLWLYVPEWWATPADVPSSCPLEVPDAPCGRPPSGVWLPQ